MADGVVADAHAHDGDGDADANGNERLEAPVPVGVFRIGGRIPEMTPDDDGNVRYKVGCAVDGVGHEGMRVAESPYDKLGDRKCRVPAEPDPGHPADFGAVIFLADASHAPQTSKKIPWPVKTAVFFDKNAFYPGENPKFRDLAEKDVIFLMDVKIF